MILETLQPLATELGFSQIGMATLQRPFSMDVYLNWLKEGHHGSMQYLQTHAPLKENPNQVLGEARSAIVVTLEYLPHPEPDDRLSKIEHLKIAQYAKGKDYHHYLKQRLENLVEKLRQTYPHHQFLTFTDSGPVLERDLAYRAGLGWVGKNSCLIHKNKGSYFFIGEILTTLTEDTEAAPHPDHCGKCRRCIDACPTDAILENRTLDARRCISYLTIESREAPPVDLRKGIGDWLFGCDICQQVCPWNEKNLGDLVKPQKQDRQKVFDELRFLLTSSNKSLQKHFKNTPLSRAGGFGLKRNAILVAVNLRATELIQEIETFKEHPKLGELANWALTELGQTQLSQ